MPFVNVQMRESHNNSMYCRIISAMRITIKKIQISFGKQCIINIKLEPNSERSAHGEGI